MPKADGLRAMAESRADCERRDDSLLTLTL